MAGRLNGKIAVITGAGSGMGKAMAELFSAEGATLVLADISGKQDAVAAALGGNAVAVHADVSKEADVEAMIAAATDSAVWTSCATMPALAGPWRRCTSRASKHGTGCTPPISVAPSSA
jgi:NAD(P)-dependent dehydrogenase (short-subunit alcohol dehydrogenase family)